MKIYKNRGKQIIYTRQFFFFTVCFALLFSAAGGRHVLAVNETDSLKSLLSEKTGRDKVDILVGLSRAKWNISMGKSLEYATMAYKLAEELDYPEGKADALNRMGNVHYLLRNYNNVIENYQLAFEIASSLQDHGRMGMYLNNLGLLFKELEQYDSSEVYLIKALRIKEQSENTELIASTLFNLGRFYREQQNYNLSLEYFVRQLDLLKETGNLRGLANSHNQTGEIFYQQERYNESIKHFLSSLSYAKEIPDSVIMARTNSFLARSYFAIDEPEKAMERIDQSMNLSKLTNSDNIIRNNYNILHFYHKKSGNYKTSLSYLKRYSNLKDSLQIRNSENRFIQLENIFETEKQYATIDLMQKEKRIQELQINRLDHIKYSLLLLLAMLGVFMFIIGYRFYQIQKTNKLIKHKILELEKTNEKLRQSSKALEQLNATKNRFFSIIAHDLKNPFNALLGFSEIMTTTFNELSEKEIRQYISILHQSSQNLYKLLENLLKWSAAQTGKMPYLPEKFDLVSLIHSEIHFIHISASKKNITISENLPDELIIVSDKVLLSSVIRNLISNAVKFTHFGGTIKLSARKYNQKVVVEVADSGIGIPNDMKDDLFRIESKICRKGTNNEDGGGLGLILCKELIEKTGGRIGVESEPGTGSRFWFMLPVKNGENSKNLHPQTESG